MSDDNNRDGQPADILSEYAVTRATYNGKTKSVYRRGSGPGVIVLHEMPGITSSLVEFSDRLVDRGFSVAIPSLFGTDGKEFSGAYLLGSVVRVCISREFYCFAANKPSPVTRWLRLLARDLHDELGGPGVGVIGMCFTGGFALAMMVDDTIAAPVMSQPSLPAAYGEKRRAAVGLSDKALTRIKDRVDGGCPVIGLRFTNDGAVPEERFDTLRKLLGDGFIAVEIDSSPGNPYGIPEGSHSVLTGDIPEDPSHPTRAALNQVLDFLDERLRTSAGASTAG